MKNQYWLVCLIPFLFCWNVVTAKETSWSLSSSVYSKYIGKVGGIFSEDPILVNELSWSRGGAFAGVWSSTGINKGSYGSTYADEVDLYVGYSHSFDWIRIQADVAYYTIKNLELMNDDIFAVDGEVSLLKIPFIQPYISFRQFAKVGRNSFPDGTFYWAGMRRTQWGISLDWMNAYSDGALGNDPGFVFTRITANYPIALNKKFTITPSVVLQRPIGGQERHQRAYTTKDEVVWGLTLVWKL